jgi:hypothetical protein
MSSVDQWEQAMELTLDAPGVTSEQLARGLAAARRVFAAAGVSALEAAVGDYEREGWGVRDLEGDIAGPLIAWADVWEDANLAARESCLSNLAGSKQARLSLNEINDMDRAAALEKAHGQEPRSHLRIALSPLDVDIHSLSGARAHYVDPALNCS